MKGGFSETRVNEEFNTSKDLFDPDSKVLVRIVNLFSDKSIVKKTQLQLASKLRWDLFSKYWEWLHTHDFIQCVDPTKKNDYALTPKGNEMFSLFIKYYEYVHMCDKILVQNTNELMPNT